jgi:hypothetical protein
MPPETVNGCEYAVPTVPVNCAEVVVFASRAGTVIVAVPVSAVSAFEVAVTVIVCAEEVAVGAVKVAEVVVSLLSAPPLTLQVTPSAVPLVLLSCFTVAVRVTASPPSTVDDEAVTATLGLELPPHAVIYTAALRTTTSRQNLFQNIKSLHVADRQIYGSRADISNHIH